MAAIAIIEDTVDNAEFLRAMLDDAGHKAECFTSGEDFFKKFEPGVFDLILLDLALPDLDGYQIFDRIRKQDSHVPIIAVTALAYTQDRERALATGFSSFITKPIVDFDAFKGQIFYCLKKDQ
jgi:CheY-like chemotaxis protein